jgi:hypothetical protein
MIGTEPSTEESSPMRHISRGDLRTTTLRTGAARRGMTRGACRAPREWSGFRPEYDRLEDRCLLAADFTQVKAKLDSLLSTLQSAVNTEALGKSLPIVGQQLGGATDAQLEFLKAIQTDVDGVLTGKETDAKTIQTELQTSLASLLGGSVNVDANNPDDVKFTMHLHANPATLSTGSFSFDIGLPGLGLKATTGPNDSVTVKAGFDFELDFEVTPTDVILDNPANFIDISLDLTLPSTFDAAGSLAFLQLDMKAMDNMGKPLNNEFKGDLVLNLANPVPLSNLAGLSPTVAVNAAADANLNAVVSFSGNSQFPSVSSIVRGHRIEFASR